MTIYCACLSFLVLVLYLTSMAVGYGVQASVSDNYYVSRNRWTFMVVMWTVAFTMLPAMFSITPDEWKFAAFLTCGGLVFVGAAAAFREDLTKRVHYFAAILSAICALIWLAVQLPIPISVTLLTLLAIVSMIERKLYWPEAMLFLYVYATYFYRVLL